MTSRLSAARAPTELESILTRRRSARFELSPPVPGCLQTAHDVRLLSVEERAVQVLSRAPGVKGERGVLEFVHCGERLTIRVRIGESTPVLSCGLIHYQVTLVFTPPVMHTNVLAESVHELD